ncbi:MAG: heme o synthase [Candidatus Acidiferrales bacterium]
MIDESQDIPKISPSASPAIRRVAADGFRDYLALTKPEINALILISTFAGGLLALANGEHSFTWYRLASAVIGTALVASGAGAANQGLEKHFDSQMSRTMRRPVAAGRIRAANAIAFGGVLAFSGAAWLFLTINSIAAMLALLAFAIYLLAYTPLKRTTPLCVPVGAVAGAIPPLIGWAACGGGFNVQAALLFGLLFLWQFPHFMAIAWLCRGDYQRAGYLVIPTNASRDRFVTLYTIVPAVGLLALTLIPVLARHEMFFLPAVCILGCAFLFFGCRLVILKTNTAARQLLTASIYYLPLAFALLILVEAYGSVIKA